MGGPATTMAFALQVLAKGARVPETTASRLNAHDATAKAAATGALVVTCCLDQMATISRARVANA